MKGFVQIPILILIVTGSMAAGAATYAGIDHYKPVLRNGFLTTPNNEQAASIETLEQEFDSEELPTSQDPEAIEPLPDTTPELFPCPPTGSIWDGIQYVKDLTDCPKPRTDEDESSSVQFRTSPTYVTPQINPPNPVSRPEPIEVKTIYTPPPRQTNYGSQPIYRPYEPSPVPNSSSFETYNSYLQQKKQESFNRNTCQQLGGAYIVGGCVY